MTWKRLAPVMAIGICLVFSFWRAFAAGDRDQGATTPPPPTIDVSVSSTEENVTLTATGTPGAAGLVRIGVLLPGPQPQLLPFYIPFVFDQTGSWSLPATPFAAFANVPEFYLVADVLMPQEPQVGPSELWGLRMRRFPVGTSGIPAPGSGNSTAYLVPGTQAPFYNYTWATTEVTTAAGPEVLFFQAAFTGIEGVIPVN